MKLTKDRISHLLGELNAELPSQNVRGELYLAGGAAMCLVYQAREATKDVDAMLVPQAVGRQPAPLPPENPLQTTGSTTPSKASSALRAASMCICS